MWGRKRLIFITGIQNVDVSSSISSKKKKKCWVSIAIPLDNPSNGDFFLLPREGTG